MINKRAENSFSTQLTNCVWFFDTVGMLLKKRPKNQEFLRLRQQCGKLTWHRSRHRRLGWKMCLHQPKPGAYSVLQEMASRIELLVNEVHIALDLCVLTEFDAEELFDWISQRLVQRWHRGRKIIWYSGTRYTGPRKWNSEIFAQYCTRPSKVTREPCVHLEFRSKGRRHVKRLVQEPADLACFNFLEFWRRHLVLEEVNMDLLGRQANGWPKAKKPKLEKYGPITMDLDRRAAGAFVRYASSTMNERVCPSAQAVRDIGRAFPWLRPKSALLQLDVSELLTRASNYPGNNQLSLIPESETMIKNI
jgi:hypothetical protein